MESNSGKNSIVVDFNSSWGNLDLLGDDEDYAESAIPKKKIAQSQPLTARSEHTRKHAKKERDLLSKSDHVPSRSPRKSAPTAKKLQSNDHHRKHHPSSPRRRGAGRELKRQLSDSKMVHSSPRRAMKKSLSSRNFDMASGEVASPRKFNMIKKLSFRSSKANLLEGAGKSEVESPRKFNMIKKLSFRSSKANLLEGAKTQQQQQQQQQAGEQEAQEHKRASSPRRTLMRRLSSRNFNCDADDQIEAIARGGLLKRLSWRNLNADGTERASSPIRTMVKSLSLRSLCCTSNYAVMDDNEVESMDSGSTHRWGLGRKRTSSLSNLALAVGKQSQIDDDEATESTEFDISCSTINTIHSVAPAPPVKARASNKPIARQLQQQKQKKTDRTLSAMLERKPKAKPNRHSSSASFDSLSSLHDALMFNPPPSPRPRSPPKGKKQRLKADVASLSPKPRSSPRGKLKAEAASLSGLCSAPVLDPAPASPKPRSSPKVKKQQLKADMTFLKGLHKAVDPSPASSKPRSSPKSKKQQLKADVASLSGLHSALVFDAPTSPRRGSGGGRSITNNSGSPRRSSSPRRGSGDGGRTTTGDNSGSPRRSSSPRRGSGDGGRSTIADSTGSPRRSSASGPSSRHRSKSISNHHRSSHHQHHHRAAAAEVDSSPRRRTVMRKQESDRRVGVNSSPTKNKNGRGTLRKQISERIFGGSQALEKQSAFEAPASSSQEFVVKKGKARKLVTGGGSKDKSEATNSRNSPRRLSEFSCESDDSSLAPKQEPDRGFAQIAFGGENQEECRVFISPTSGRKTTISGIANAIPGLLLDGC